MPPGGNEPLRPLRCALVQHPAAMLLRLVILLLSVSAGLMAHDAASASEGWLAGLRHLLTAWDHLLMLGAVLLLAVGLGAAIRRRGSRP